MPINWILGHKPQQLTQSTSKKKNLFLFSFKKKKKKNHEGRVKIFQSFKK